MATTDRSSGDGLGERRFRYVVLFNDPILEFGWGYTGLTVCDTRHEAVGLMAKLRRRNPETEYRIEVFG